MVISFLSILLVAHVHFVFGKSCWNYNECQQQSLTGNTQCKGFLSCYQSTIIAGANVVQCSGYYGCYKANTISSTWSVYCEGVESCGGAGSISGDYVYCRSLSSCKGITGASGVSAKNDVVCDGEYSCSGSTINAGNNAFCNGRFSCSGSTIIAVDDLNVHGDNAARGATISAERVYVYSFQGTYGAKMDSTDELAMKVYLYGYESGKGATFTCRSGSTCDVYCMSNGCQGMTYQCEDGATCNMDCYDPGNDGCPTLINAPSFPKAQQHINKLDHFESEEGGINDFDYATNTDKVVLVLLIVGVAVTAIHCITAMKSKEIEKILIK